MPKLVAGKLLPMSLHTCYLCYCTVQRQPTRKPQGLHKTKDLINAYRRCGGLFAPPYGGAVHFSGSLKTYA